MKTLEAWYGVPPERESPVVQLFLAGCGPQWGEVVAQDGQLILEISHPVAGAGIALSLPVEELLEVLRLARDRLKAA